MYTVNGICYAGEPGIPVEEIRVLDAIPLTGGMLLVTFSNGEKRLFDALAATESVFTPLHDEKIFQTAKVEHGFVSWLDGTIDIAPEYMYEHSLPYDQFDILHADSTL